MNRQAAFALLGLLLATTAALAQQEQRSFYADRRAYRPGDVLTVQIVESSSVTAAAQTRTNKSESGGVSVSHTAGQQQFAAGLSGQSAGGGEIDRSDKFVAQLAVAVQAVDPNGNLRVHGEQDITVNDEKQHIRLDGTVREEDIGPDNTVKSTRVGGAHIEFTGKGILARKQSPGLLNRILSFFWE
jgi:flagellar L-ring protein precursor FlgH